MNRRNEMVVGAVILAALALIFFGTLWLSGKKLGVEERLITARFREVGQLLEGNTVKMRGVPIGTVAEIQLERGGNAVLVTMRVDPEMTLPEDAVAILAPESMFGDWQAEILSRSQFPRYAYAEPRDPKHLPGYSLPDISRLTAVADRIAENVAVLSERIGLAFTEETAQNIREAIDNFQQVSTQLTELIDSQERTIVEVGSNLQVSTRTLGEAAEMARDAFAQVEAAIDDGELETIVRNASMASARVDTLTTALLQTSEQLRAVAVSADSMFGPAQTLLSQISRGEGTLGKLVQDTALYGELIQTNRQVQLLLADLQANPRKYIQLRVF